MSESELAQDAPRGRCQLFAAAISATDRAKIPAMFLSAAAPRDVAIAMKVLWRAVPARHRSRPRTDQVPPLRIVDAVLRAQVHSKGTRRPDSACGSAASGSMIPSGASSRAGAGPAAARRRADSLDGGRCGAKQYGLDCRGGGQRQPASLEAALSAVKQTKDEEQPTSCGHWLPPMPSWATPPRPCRTCVAHVELRDFARRRQLVRPEGHRRAPRPERGCRGALPAKVPARHKPRRTMPM